MKNDPPTPSGAQITLADLSQELRYLASMLGREFPDSTENRILQALLFSKGHGAKERSEFLQSARQYLLGPAQ